METIIEIIKGLSKYILVVAILSIIVNFLASLGGIFEIIALIIILGLFWLKFR